jgi:hypothetical protein
MIRRVTSSSSSGTTASFRKCQRQIGQHLARGHALLCVGGGQAGQLVTRAMGWGLGQQRAQIGKVVALVAGQGVAHSGSASPKGCT